MSKVKCSKEMNTKQQELFNKLSGLQQRFSLNVLTGKYSNRESYTKAGGECTTNESLDATASGTLRLTKVSEFISEMKKTLVSKAIMDAEEMAEKLTSLSRASLSDIIEFGEHSFGKDENGDNVVQSTWKIKPESMQSKSALASISELTSSRDGLKIKQHSSLQAMKQLAELQGYNQPTKIKINKDEELTPFSSIISGEDEVDV